MYIKLTKNTHLTNSKNTLKIYNKRVMENCLQMYSDCNLEFYNAIFKIKNDDTGQTIEYDTVQLCYDNSIKLPWVVKYWNSNKGKIKYKLYQEKKEAQAFIRGRKRRMQRKVEKAHKEWKLKLSFEYEESKDY